MRISSILLKILLLSQIFWAQQVSIETLREKYANFEYKKVIELADEMLQQNNYDRTTLVQIYEMKGVAHYSLGEEQKAHSAFWNLLGEDNNYSMDPQQISPKIISFFNDVKEEFREQIEEEKPILDSLNTLKQRYLSTSSNYKTAIVKNIILPGWGQFQLNNKTKGTIYGVLGVSTIASSIYYIAKTNDKRTDYLSETNPELIKAKYDEYNDAYKLRNYAISAAVAVWLASQIDILFFSEDHSKLPISYNYQPENNSEIKLTFSIPLR